MNFIEYCKNLKSSDWDIMITSKWNVKDIVAHMIVWEKHGIKDLDNYIKNGNDEPLKDWTKEMYDKYNNDSLKEYENYTPEQLIEEWRSSQMELGKLIDRIGLEELRKHEGLKWLINNREGKVSSHYEKHYSQVREVLDKEN